jgi:hypothetical protein
MWTSGELASAITCSATAGSVGSVAQFCRRWVMRGFKGGRNRN